MNIYEIGQDFDNYKFFVFKEDDESNKGVWDYNGQSLINEWKGLSLELFRDKRKKKDKRSEEFDASCYFSGCLIVNKRTSLLLSEKLKGQIKCSNEKNNEQWKKLQENRVEISNLNMDVAKRDDEIVMLRKEIEVLKTKLQKFEDKQSAKQDASKQNSTKKSLFGRKK